MLFFIAETTFHMSGSDGMNSLDGLYFILLFIFICWEFAFDFKTSSDVVLGGESAIAIGGIDLICAELMAFTRQFIIGCTGFFKTGAFVEIVEREFLNKINATNSEPVNFRSKFDPFQLFSTLFLEQWGEYEADEAKQCGL